MNDAFEKYHPIVNMLFFMLVIGCGMLIMHPVCLAVSFFWAFIYSLWQKGKKTLFFNLVFLLPMMLATAALNPLFSHQGVTVLIYVNDNPITLESVYYGIAAAFMLAAIITWFSSFNRVMTSDKIVYLFGRIIPALSLVLSMSLRFIPRFSAQTKIIIAAQRCVGHDIHTGGLLKRARRGIKILSIMVTWAFENAVETADSMKSRGYGLKGRTTFSNFRLDKRDIKAIIFLGLCGGIVIVGIAAEGFKFDYYPALQGDITTPWLVCLYIVYFAMCGMPVFINILEEITWRIKSASPSGI